MSESPSRTTFTGFVRSALESPRIVILTGIIAFVITLTSLRYGFAIDDFGFRSAFKGFPGIPEYAEPKMQTFSFSNGDPARNEQLINRGVAPWWSVPNGKLAFWRPLASISHWIDFNLWGDRAWPMHIVSMLWYAGLCMLLAVLYRRLNTPIWVAGVAAILYSIDGNFGWNVGWISARNAIMASLFVVATLIAHDKWRREGWTPGAVLAPLCFAIGMLSAEAAIGGLAYLGAYMLFLDKHTWKERIVSVLPYGAVFLVWNVFYRAWGFGALGTAYYFDPAHQTHDFLRAVIARMPYLVMTECIFEPNMLGLQMGIGGVVGSIVGILVLVAVLVLVTPMLIRDATARFWFVGMVLAMIPACTGIGQPRYLIIAGIGGSALIAKFLCTVASCSDWMPAKGWLRAPFYILAAVWFFFHVIVAPVNMALMCAMPGHFSWRIETALQDLPATADVTDKTLILFRGGDDFNSWHLHVMRSADGIPIPAFTRLLSTGYGPMEVSRPDAKTLILTPKFGFVRSQWTSLFRSPGFPMHVGEKVHVTGMDVTIRAVSTTGWPTEAQFVFDDSLDASKFLWYAAVPAPVGMQTTRVKVTTLRFIPVAPPKIGETVSMDDLARRSPAYAPMMEPQTVAKAAT